MYVNKVGYLERFGSLIELDLSSTGVAGASWFVLSECQVSRLLASISTVFSSTAAAVVSFVDRPTHGSATNQVSMGTLTVGTSGGVGTVGQVYYKDIAPYKLLPGHEVVMNVTTAATTSGKIVPGMEILDNPERSTNNSNMIASI